MTVMSEEYTEIDQHVFVAVSFPPISIPVPVKPKGGATNLRVSQTTIVFYVEEEDYVRMRPNHCFVGKSLDYPNQELHPSPLA